MQESLEASLIRIRTATGRVVGAGFLVGERHILTCAHVVSQALGLSDTAVDLPQAAVSLDFPRIPPHTLLTASVVQWCPPLPDGSGDIAGLELACEPPSGAEVVRFVEASNVWKHDFSALGFPTGYDDGVWTTGRLLRRQATNWIQIEDVKAQGFAVAPGFSGTPVWDEQLQGVIGMVVASSRLTDTKTAFVIPLDVLVAAWPHLTIPRGEPRNPYKGLRPFTQDDTRDFFGREQVVDKLVDTIAQLVAEQPAATSKRLLTILGPSGSGKSSLVMAGLLPRLQQGALPSSEAWTYLEPMVPGKHPLEALILSLAPCFPDRSFTSLREDLQDREARGLHQLAAHLLTTRKGKSPGAKVLLLVDQFEELFTQTESEDERERFMQLLLVACSEPNGALLGLLTLRADFYDRPMGYPVLYQMIEAHQVALLSMDTKDLRRVIEQPAALPDVQLTFEGDLVENVLSEVRGQAGALPLLQFTLHQLFQQRSGRQLTISAYRDLGGVKGALTRQAEKTYTELPSEEHRKLARALFVRLIDPGASEQDTTRRRAVLSEFTLDNPTQTRLMRETIDAFIAARLLTTNEVSDPDLAHSKLATIEVSHEALIREWRRLTEWMREARQDIPLQQTISKDVAEWERRGKPADRLYRGSQLKEARIWAIRSLPSRNEMAFLHASAAQRIRDVAIVTVIVLLLLSTTGIAGWFISRPNPTYVNALRDNGTGSLRWAIAVANPGSTITFDTSLRGTILLTSGDLNIAKDLTIRGSDAHMVSISSGKSGHIVHILGGVTVTIFGLIFKDSKTNSGFIDNEGRLTLSNSSVSGNMATGGGSGGGGIVNNGTLTLTSSSVSGNMATIGGSGGIVNNGTLTLNKSTVSHNMATGNGGIVNVGTLTLSNSTVSDNTAYSGGGIYNAVGGTLTLSNSSVSGNTASQDGGGIENNGGTLTLSNSTVSDNKASHYGGGIYNFGPLKLTSSTVSGNTATNGGGIYNQFMLMLSNSTVSSNTATSGGGIFIQSYALSNGQSNISQADLTFCTIYGNMASAGGDIAVEDMAISDGQDKAIKQISQVRISNSIVANNSAHPGPDISGTLISYGYNLFQDNSRATFDPATSKQHSTDKTLSVNDLSSLFAAPVGLRNNGGPTMTYALGPDSPALDLIPLDACHVTVTIYNDGGTPIAQHPITTDQRGVKRPDGNEQFCDIGAYESVDSG